MEGRVAAARSCGVLDISGTGISVLPAGLGGMLEGGAPVRRVVARGNRLSKAPAEELAALAGTITELDLARNNISELPDGMAALTKLEALDLGKNRIAGSIPSFVTVAFSALTRLDLSGNSLMHLPDDIGSLQGLRELHVHHNSLVALPLSICSIVPLSVISAACNEIQSLPADIGNLKNLKKLDVSNNNLRRLPAGFRGLDSLVTLELGDNPWVSPQPSVCERGKDAVFAELKRLSSAKANAARSEVSDVSDCVAGAEFAFAVVARDAEGVPRISGGDTVKAALVGPVTVAASVADNGDGTYRVSATPAVAGAYDLVVAIDDSPLPICPVPVRVRPTDSDVDPYDTDACDTVKCDGDDDVAGKIVAEFRVGNLDQYAKLLRTCREFNVQLDVPEVVLCGFDGHERFAEALWGLYPFDIGAGGLSRPLVLNFVHTEECQEPRLTLRRDRLLGSSVSGGMRDMQVTLPYLKDFVDARGRNPAVPVSSVPIVLQVESALHMTFTAIIAPSVPPKDSPHRAGVEHVLSELLRPTCRAIVCALPCMGWKLVQSSSWVSRIIGADPTLSRTTFAFTGLSALIGSFHSPAALDEYFRGCPSALHAVFVTLPGDKLRSACSDAAAYKRRLWQVAELDRRALERLDCDSCFLRSCIGISALRTRVQQRITRQYQSQTPALQQRVADITVSAAASVAFAESQLKALSAADLLPGVLRVAASNHSLEFCKVAADVLRGTSEASDGSCICGGADFVRVLDGFRGAAAAAAAKGTAAAVPNTLSAAAEIAQREARDALSPLVDRLCDEAMQSVQRMSEAVEVLLAKRLKHRQPNCACTGECALLRRLGEFSYLPRNVKDLFVEIAGRRITAFHTACESDFLVPVAGFDLPALDLDGASPQDGNALAATIFNKLVTQACENIGMRFLSVVLRELSETVPTEMHAAFMSLQDKQLANFFKLQALEDTIKQEQANAQKQLEDSREQHAAVKAISL